MNQKPPTSSPPVEYGLRLSDGAGWRLSGIDGQSEWVDRFAAIMELEESRLNGSPKLIFSSKKTVPDVNNIKPAFAAARLNTRGRDAGWTVDNPASFRIWSHKRIPDVICNIIHMDECEEIQILNMWFALFPIYQRGLFMGGLPFHAGLVELDGKGVLLCAAGGVGKSTCCRRLPDYWRSLCDDETLVVLDKREKYRAHPFPTWSNYLWKRSEKTWNVQYSAPLHGIFFLEQSGTDELEPINVGQAIVLINESAAQIYEKFQRGMDKENKRSLRKEIFNNACEIAKRIPTYRLRASRRGGFWKKMERVLGS